MDLPRARGSAWWEGYPLQIIRLETPSRLVKAIFRIISRFK